VADDYLHAARIASGSDAVRARFCAAMIVIAATGAPTQSSRSRATRVPRHITAASRESPPLLTPFVPAFALAPAAHQRQFLIRYQQLENNVNP
jgi:hypothetical protein